MFKRSLLIFISAVSWPVAMAQYSAGTVTFDSLKRLIIEKNVGTIEALLPLLPDSFRSHYALMFNSRSLQEASYRDPRVILYGPEAKFIITFNGNPGLRGFDALETMEFDDGTKSFRFHEITFPKKSTESAVSASQVRFSESNPDKCLKCHGSPSRPIWDTYPVWPGAYGERDHQPLSAKEREGLADFLRNQAAHPRYRPLAESKLFLERDSLLARAATRYDGSSATDPNSDLSALLSKLNFQAIASEVGGSPGFPAYRYALLASLEHDCGNIEDFLPEQVRSTFRRSYRQFAIDSDRVNRNQDRLKQLRALPRTDSGNLLPFSTQTGGESSAKFRYLVEQGLRISTDQWSPALEKGTYDFTTPGMSMIDIRPYILAEVTRDDPHIRDLSTISSSSNRYCSYLKARSLLALSGISVQPVAALHVAEPPRSPRPGLIQRCVGCHETGVGPALVFSNPDRLARELSTRKYSRGFLLDEILYRLSPEAGAHRMPLGLNISDEERKGLEDYFRSLAK